VRISQAPCRSPPIKARRASSARRTCNFENNVWNFKGNVKISMDQGQLTSEDAQITFVNSLLSKAIVNGSRRRSSKP